MSDRTLPGIPHKKSRAGIVVAIVFALIVLAITIASLLGSGSPSAPGAGSASYYCEKAVGERLKAPDSASYNGTATNDNGKWDVSGIVTSDNSFGASVRAAYSCTVTFVGDVPTTVIDYIDG